MMTEYIVFLRIASSADPQKKKKKEGKKKEGKLQSNIYL